MSTGNQRREAVALNNHGWNLAQLSDYHQAITCCEQALALHGKFGNRAGEAATLDTLGFINQRLGDHATPIRCYLRAAALLAEVGNIFGHAITLNHIGDNYLAAGHRQKAAEAWQQALRILDDLRRPDAEQVRGKLWALAVAGSVQVPPADYFPQHSTIRALATVSQRGPLPGVLPACYRAAVSYIPVLSEF